MRAPPQQGLKRGFQGLTVLEMLVALSGLTVLLAFASPGLQDSSARAEMRQATNQISEAFRTAKNVARLANLPVTLVLKTQENGDNRIIFAFPSGGNNPADHTGEGHATPALADVILPDDVVITADAEAFTFSPLGMIDKTVTISIVSTVNPEFASVVAINTLMGHVSSEFAVALQEHDGS